MKFFLDANLPSSSKEIFKKYGQPEHARDIGMAGATDKEILDHASKSKAITIVELGRYRIRR